MRFKSQGAAPKRQAKPSQPTVDTKAETGLVLLGCGAAALSAAFAVYAVTTSGSAPEIPGKEHLLIFARPALARQNEPASVAASEPALNPLETDPITTGSIGVRRPRGAASDREAATISSGQPNLLPAFALRGIFNGKALLQGPEGFVMAGEGAYVRGAGTIRSIEATRKGWVVMTSEGRIE